MTSLRRFLTQTALVGQLCLGLGQCSVSAEPFPLELVNAHSGLDFHTVPVVSPDGRWLAYGVSQPAAERSLRNGVQYTRSWAPTGTTGTRLHVLNLETRKDFAVGPPDVPAIRPSWSPDGSRIAFYAQQGPSMTLFSVSWPEGSLAVFSEIPVHPRRGGGDEPLWLDSDRVVVPTVRPEDREMLEEMDRPSSQTEEPRVQRTGSSGTPKDLSPFVKADAMLPMIVNLKTRQSHPLPLMPQAKPPSLVLLSPSRKALAYLTISELQGQSFVCDLITGSVDGKAPWKRVANLDLFYQDSPVVQWHPSQERLFFQSKRRLSEVDLSSGRATPFGPERLDYPFRFTADGAAIITLRADDSVAPSWASPSQAPRSVVQIPLDGSPSKIELPTPWPEKIVDALPDGRLVLRNQTGLTFFDTKTSQTQPIFESNGVLASRALLPGHSGVVLEMETASDPPALYLLSGYTGQPKKLLTLDPRLDHVTESRVESFETLVRQGEQEVTVTTAVSLPSGASKTAPAPAIVYLYPGAFDSKNARRFLGAPVIPTPVFTSRGYAVVVCDAPIGPVGVPGNPSSELAAVILPQVRAAVDRGLIDPERLAVMGHSHGGYAAAALLAESDIFEAGVALMGLYDLGASYSSEDGAEHAYLRGQLRMGVPPWSDPDRYRRNSPYYRATDIKAPLLLIAGENDRACPPWEAEKMWNALRTLGGTSELAIYPGEDHVLRFWSAPHRIDACQRVLRFLDQHLASERVEK